MSSFFSVSSKTNGSRGEGSKSPGSQPSSNAHSDSLGSRLGLGFLKLGNRNEKEQKKRGPKPDQRPPQTERQARNRKAQRTHRERRDRYIKTLEEEVLRLREAFTVITKEKTQILEENRRLKEILQVNGIDASTVPISSQAQTNLASNESGGAALNLAEIAQQFVVTLEAACTEHIQVLASNAAQSSDVFSGHALMATMPPESHSINNPNQDWGRKTVDLPPEDLAILYNLEMQEMERQKYVEMFNGELSPIAAWTLITNHPRFNEINLQDFTILTEELAKKATCHGFGAVIEEFEVQDALASVFATKNVAFS